MTCRVHILVLVHEDGGLFALDNLPSQHGLERLSLLARYLSPRAGEFQASPDANLSVEARLVALWPG